MKKLIPYKGKKTLLKGLILKHRSKVISITRIFSRAITAKSRSHDNSLAGEFELKYTAWMANQDIELTDEEYEVALRNHYKENDHHLEHFLGIDCMDLAQLFMYLADVMARASYDIKDHDPMIGFLTNVNEILSKEVNNREIEAILYRTAKMLIKYDTNGVKGIFEHESEEKTE